MSYQRDEGMDEPVRDCSQAVGHRRYLRFPVSVPVVGRAAQFGRTELHGMVRDIGGGGLLAEFSVWIVPGSIVDFTLQTRHGPVAITGQVAWTGPPGNRITHGIAFREPRGDAFALEFWQRETGSSNENGTLRDGDRGPRADRGR